MRKRLLFLGGSFGVFLFFVLFSYIVHKDIFLHFDFDTTVKLQDNISRKYDHIFSVLSTIGSFEIVTLFLLGILVIRRKIIGGIASLFAYGVFHVLELYGKLFVEHPPPPEFMVRTEKLVEFPQFHVRAEFSYPSGHSGRALFISVLLFTTIWFSKKLSLNTKILLLTCVGIYDIVMLVSRIYLGEHWASDVIGGAILGISLGFLASI